MTALCLTADPFALLNFVWGAGLEWHEMMMAMAVQCSYVPPCFILSSSTPCENNFSLKHSKAIHWHKRRSSGTRIHTPSANPITAPAADCSQ